MSDTGFHTLEDEYSYACLDDDRLKRQGFPEVVYCASKETSHLVSIYKSMYEKNGCAFGTRATKEQAEAVRKAIPEAEYDEISRILKVGRFVPEYVSKLERGDATGGVNESSVPSLIGNICICSAGTSDVPVCEEAAQTAEFFGSKVTRVYDVGVSGIHRLLDKVDVIRQANCVIVVAGMEGALASVIGGLVSVPVVAVPTSVGYGASFEGLSALLTMINTCANGVTVVNIDNGYGAGYVATQINRLAEGVGNKR